MESARWRQCPRGRRAVRLSQVVGLSLLFGVCGCVSKPAGLHLNRDPDGSEPDTTQVRRIGCLQLALVLQEDRLARGPVVRVTFFNSCQRAIEVDLGAFVVTARYRDGRQHPMQVYDPKGVIRPGVLDSYGQGWEVLEYHPAIRDSVSMDISEGELVHDSEGAGQPVALCFDMAAVNASEVSAEPAGTCLSLVPSTTTPITTMENR